MSKHLVRIPAGCRKLRRRETVLACDWILAGDHWRPAVRADIGNSAVMYRKLKETR